MKIQESKTKGLQAKKKYSRYKIVSFRQLFSLLQQGTGLHYGLKSKTWILPALLFSFFSLKAQQPVINLDSLPLSQIIVPIQINLKPVYALAEKNVDVVFTSPNYPEGWVQLDCGTRYKYHFRRSPLIMKTSGTTMDLSFTGFYQITGSTRACVKGIALSPWTTPCNCGFSEGERKVAVNFTSKFSFQPNHQVNVAVTRKEPQPITKCTVCFWGQDVTNQVMNGLKEELDAAKKAIEDSFRIVNTRPYMQAAWNKLNELYAIPGLGYLKLNPKKMHMENIYAKDDLLNINIGITASPMVSFELPSSVPSLVPNLSPAGGKSGFNIFLDAALNYDSLSNVVNGYLQGKRFDFKEAIFNRYIIIDSCRVGGNDKGDLVVYASFSGSHNGEVLFTGKPFYNEQTKSIEVAELDYDLVTKDFLLKTAKWLFNKKIITEMKKYTTFNMNSYYDTASKALDSWINKEWVKGVKSTGKVNELKLTNVKALPEYLYIQTNCAGNLSLRIDELNWSF
jgi:hypothetical protein